jgi:hypothetical protein
MTAGMTPLKDNQVLYFGLNGGLSKTRAVNGFPHYYVGEKKVLRLGGS